MNEPIEINIFEIVGSEFCVAADDGQKVFDQIALALQKGLKVKISFANISRLTSAFLNVALGQLYGSFSEQILSSNLSVSEIESHDRSLLIRVIETAKAYFRNPNLFDKVRDNIMGEKKDADQ
ncbi:MAG: STAS-like domain-containing protein [Chloroflexi bacterium]|nr:STAS-like domain-containing protein [Chloroflexota bacterium]